MADFAPRKGMTPAEIEAVMAAVLAAATLSEKVGMMSGAGFFKAYLEDGKIWAARPYRAGGGLERLGIAPFWFTDGPRGVARGQSTCFPCTMARGASFDVDLERRIGEVMGIEARAQGCNLSGAVCINLLRHPAWGRAQETYGEDPHHLGEMGAALATGIQAHNVAATVKHFALNSMENARFNVDVEIDERALHEVYLPHFKHVLEAGCSTVMSAYNKMNGEYCGQNRPLLTEILRDEWGFDGFVHSDWVKGVYDVSGAAAGLDVENPEPLVFGRALVAAVEDGRIAAETVDLACERILRVWYRFACALDPLPEYGAELVACPAHIAIALEAAEKSAVLLKNDGVLPFRKGIGTLAVLGKMAALENTGDNGSSKVRPTYVVTALDGLQRARNRLGIGEILTADEDDLSAAADAASAADAVIVVVGNTAEDEGEFIPGDIALGEDVPEELRGQARAKSIGGDRDNLGLRADQIALIDAAVASGKPLVVAIVSGSAMMVEEWHDRASAIMQTFYSGMEGGTALAKLLFGEVSPSGKLPFTVAQAARDYPFFDKDADGIVYDLWHGYSLLDRDGRTPRYAFGHGLSYANFVYRDLTASVTDAVVKVEVSVT
ncbi:MAG TPA: glycoside hydrolase family 3 C-terminal domain-containing protein, partial [Sphingorhabdus sp.]|nr:glycoside hydrolase family 3 C-terminal domain-containing protein [Sphingorhabdus sp.]